MGKDGEIRKHIKHFLERKRIHSRSIFFLFLGLHVQHMGVPGLGVKSELQLLAYATATATPDPSLICDHGATCSNARSLTH